MHYESDIEGEDGVADDEKVIESMLSASGADPLKVEVKAGRTCGNSSKMTLLKHTRNGQCSPR